MDSYLNYRIFNRSCKLIDSGCIGIYHDDDSQFAFDKAQRIFKGCAEGATMHLECNGYEEIHTK